MLHPPIPVNHAQVHFGRIARATPSVEEVLNYSPSSAGGTLKQMEAAERVHRILELEVVRSTNILMRNINVLYSESCNGISGAHTGSAETAFYCY